MHGKERYANREFDPAGIERKPAFPSATLSRPARRRQRVLFGAASIGCGVRRA
jgi:hypothetical protein